MKLTILTLAANGSVTTDEQEVLTIADENGNPVEIVDVRWERQMLAEIEAVRLGIEELVGHRLRLEA